MRLGLIILILVVSLGCQIDPNFLRPPTPTLAEEEGVLWEENLYTNFEYFGDTYYKFSFRIFGDGTMVIRHAKVQSVLEKPRSGYSLNIPIPTTDILLDVPSAGNIKEEGVVFYLPLDQTDWSGRSFYGRKLKVTLHLTDKKYWIAEQSFVQQLDVLFKDIPQSEE